MRIVPALIPLFALLLPAPPAQAEPVRYLFAVPGVV